MSDITRVTDEIALPGRAVAIRGSARRDDAYPVYVTADERAALERLEEIVGEARVALVTDSVVDGLHAERLVARLSHGGRDVIRHVVPAGEASKSVATAVALLDWLASSEIGRRDVMVALGGGVVIDTAGWVASAYMRGIPYVNVPTTLLAHVDAALGGKVAVDHPAAKNLIGAFYQPMAVVSNVSFLQTLDLRQIRSGLAEVVKKGVIASPALFELVERRLDELLALSPVALEELVRGASAVKCELIARDPYEENLDRPLNFGHTIGHAVETITGYGPVLHGEAVAFGMVVASRISRGRGVMDPAHYWRLLALLSACGLPTELAHLPVAVDADAVVAAMEKIRLIRAGSLRFVLPVRLGETVIAGDVSREEIEAALTTPAERKVAGW